MPAPYFFEGPMRTQIFFNRDWYFYHGEKEQEPGSRDLTDYRKVPLPHDWSLDYPFSEDAACLGSGGYVETGIGYYKKLFCYDKKTGQGMRTLLCFDGVYMNSTVWLNGQVLGSHVYGYTPFEYDLTDFLEDGENLLCVKVDNSRQPNSRWYSGSGITRNVRLLTLPRTHIASYGLHAYTGQEKDGQWKLHVETEVENAGKASCEVEYILEDEEGGVCFSGDSYALTSPKLWSAEDPALYTLTARLFKDGEAVDQVSIRIGIRETAFDAGKGFLCNGKQIKLRGVCMHHDCGAVGAAVPKSMYERRLRKLKEMGCNAIRMSHNPPNPELLDLCDELGFFVMDEAFDEWNITKLQTLGSNTDSSTGYSAYFEECHEEDLTLMLKRDRNHPCVVLWSIGNEIPNQTDREGHLLARKLKEIVRKYDLTRPITVACDQIEAEPGKATEEFLQELDVVGYNYVGRWRKRAETYYDTDKQDHPEWKMIGTENSSLGTVRGKYLTEMVNRGGWLVYPYFSAPVQAGRLLRFTETRDYVAGDFMWTGFDYLGEAHWPSRSSSSGVMDSCGFEKMGYYFYQSLWNREKPMVHLEPHWNFKEHDGSIIPVLCFTNCEEAELFVNGKSYGRKAYSYPSYGMTETYGHYDKIPAAPVTDNLFLSWDVPFEDGEVLVKGYNDGVEVVSETLRTALKPEKIETVVYNDRVSLEDVIQLEVSLLDANGTLCADCGDEIRVTCDKGYVIGCDNGDPEYHESLRTDHIHALAGKAFFLLKGAEPGICKVTAASGKISKKITVTIV